MGAGWGGGGELPPHGAGVTLGATVLVFPLTAAPLRGGQGRRALVHPAVTVGAVTAPCKARVGTVPCSGHSWGLGLNHRQCEFVLVPPGSAVRQGTSSLPPGNSWEQGMS